MVDEAQSWIGFGLGQLLQLAVSKLHEAIRKLDTSLEERHHDAIEISLRWFPVFKLLLDPFLPLPFNITRTLVYNTLRCLLSIFIALPYSVDLFINGDVAEAGLYDLGKTINGSKTVNSQVVLAQIIFTFKAHGAHSSEQLLERMLGPAVSPYYVLLFDDPIDPPDLDVTFAHRLAYLADALFPFAIPREGHFDQTGWQS